MKIGRKNGFTEKSLESSEVLGHPRLDVVETMIALGDDKHEPDGEQIAGGERPLPMQRCG
jgi:hypothetical protein